MLAIQKFRLRQFTNILIVSSEWHNPFKIMLLSFFLKDFMMLFLSEETMLMLLDLAVIILIFTIFLSLIFPQLRSDTESQNLKRKFRLNYLHIRYLSVRVY